MKRTCTQCGSAFLITDDDLAFYDKVSPVFHGKKELIPPPTLCPECRQQRRASFRNERFFYHNICAHTQKPLIAMYQIASPFIVYSQDAWWGDEWDALSYGRVFDTSHSFFEQFASLRLVVPRPNLYGKGNENSSYTNHTDQAKNSYLCADIAFSDTIFFSKYVIGSRDCAECYMTNRSELCYETLYTEGYRCIATRMCEQCSECAFLYDCKGCRDCFLCWNLRGRQYCIENVQYSKEEYERRKNAYGLHTYSGFNHARMQFEELILRAIRLPTLSVNCEESSGEALHNCKNVRASYDVGNAQDCAYCYLSDSLRDCFDTYESAFECELQYEGYACNRGKNLCACSVSYDVSSLYYCDICHNSTDCFGCIGLKHKSYCILNKQYTKEEYESLAPKIIEKMRADEQWGEFFPITMSPFAYNETTAMEYFPLSKDEVLARGWKWRDQTDEIPKVEKILPAAQLPDSIDDIPDDILNWAIECEATKRPFKIIKQELEFYRNMKLPVPRFHPDERHRRRMALRNPRKLWDRECAKCKKPIATSYSPERSEIVYCESCYLQTVY